MAFNSRARLQLGVLFSKMFSSLFNFLSFGFLIPLLESLFNVWKQQKGNGWSVFYAIKRHTHTHDCMPKICWSICGKKVSDWRRRSTSAVAQDALKFKVRSTQSDGGSVDTRRPTSPPSALLISANLTVFTSRRFQGFTSFLYSPRSWKAFSEKIKLTAEWRFLRPSHADELTTRQCE